VVLARDRARHIHIPRPSRRFHVAFWSVAFFHVELLAMSQVRSKMKQPSSICSSAGVGRGGKGFA
jgi:hypothetical protein